MYDPWIFRKTDHYFNTGEMLPDPGFEERIKLMSRHLDLMVEVFGEAHGCRLFRKIAPWYFKRSGPASEFNRRIARLSTRAEFNDIVDRYRKWRLQFLDATGDLAPRFRPTAAARAMPDDTDGSPALPVPQGPNEIW